MTVVSNTSPLLNLSIIGRLDLVRSQFGHVLIPDAVRDELEMNSGRPGSATLRAAVSEGWIRVQNVATATRAHVRTLRQSLDQGESEAIALAAATDASLLLLNEREGRKHARAIGLPVTGAIGILLRAHKNGGLLHCETRWTPCRMMPDSGLDPRFESAFFKTRNSKVRAVSGNPHRDVTNVG